jgi:hypothetical protein
MSASNPAKLAPHGARRAPEIDTRLGPPIRRSTGSLCVVVGIAAGIIVTRLMTRLLYQVSASNPFVFGGAAAALLAFALLACYVPARRATRVDPLVALKDE